VIQTLEDPALKSDGRLTEGRQAVRDITAGIFDWAEMARRTLGRHWDARSEAERAEFAGLFRELVKRALMSRIECTTARRSSSQGRRSRAAAERVHRFRIGAPARNSQNVSR
jgi:ABC-type transporter MlaC component